MYHRCTIDVPWHCQSHRPLFELCVHYWWSLCHSKPWSSLILNGQLYSVLSLPASECNRGIRLATKKNLAGDDKSAGASVGRLGIVWKIVYPKITCQVIVILRAWYSQTHWQRKDRCSKSWSSLERRSLKRRTSCSGQVLISFWLLAWCRKCRMNTTRDGCFQVK